MSAAETAPEIQVRLQEIYHELPEAMRRIARLKSNGTRTLPMSKMKERIMEMKKARRVPASIQSFFCPGFWIFLMPGIAETA